MIVVHSFNFNSVVRCTVVSNNKKAKHKKKMYKPANFYMHDTKNTIICQIAVFKI